MKHLLLFLLIVFATANLIDNAWVDGLNVASDDETYKPNVGTAKGTVGAGSRG